MKAVAVLLQLHQWTFVTFPRTNCRNHYNNNSARKFITLISPHHVRISDRKIHYSAELTISYIFVFCFFFFFLGLNFWFEDLVQVRVLWGIVFIFIFIFIVNRSKELCDSVNWFHSVWFPTRKEVQSGILKTAHTNEKKKKKSFSKRIGSRLNWPDNRVLEFLLLWLVSWEPNRFVLCCLYEGSDAKDGFLAGSNSYWFFILWFLCSNFEITWHRVIGKRIRCMYTLNFVSVGSNSVLLC